MAYRIGRAEFEMLVEEALDGLPERFREVMENVSVAVEDLPSEEEARSVGVPRDELLGLFQGAGHAESGGFFDLPHMPDRIVLYQKNIETVCESRTELLDEISATLLHEVGHYFGMSEEDLEEYE